MTSDDAFELINSTVNLLHNFMFSGHTLDYVNLDNSTSEHSDDDLRILKKIDLDPSSYSIRDVINKITQLIRESSFDLGSYIHESRNISASYPIGYLIFDYCLASLYGSKVDAALYASHIFYMFNLDNVWNILLQSIILSKLTDDKDVRRFLVMLAVSVKPLSADSHISSYPEEYADRMTKFEKEASLFATW